MALKETLEEKRERAHLIEERLYAEVGPSKPSLNFSNPFELVVAVVLSAQTTDAAVNKVTPILFKQFPTPEALAAAPTESVEEIIHPLGTYKNKARHIRSLAHMLVTDFSSTVPCDINELQKLPSVGRKTANCVMVAAFGKAEGIAVDTHVFRIAHRLGLANPEDTTPQKVESALMELYPQKIWLMLNHQLVWFGRTYCTARNPKCGACPLNDICPTYKEGHF